MSQDQSNEMQPVNTAVDNGNGSGETERRASLRMKPPKENPTTLVFGETEYIGILTDISKQGAGFRIDLSGRQLDINRGTVFMLTLKSPAGTMTQKAGRVMWLKYDDQSCRLGVQFIRIEKEQRAQPKLLNMDEVRIDPLWAMRVPPNLAIRRQFLPIAEFKGQVHVACANVNDKTGIRALQRFIQLPIQPLAAEPDSLKRAIDRLYGELAKSGVSISPHWNQSIDLRSVSLDEESEGAVSICNELLYAAVVRGASDIHIDPCKDTVRVRFRVDGVIENYRELPEAIYAGMISRYKVLSDMDIAEKRSPQDGGFRHAIGTEGQSYDIRTATLPTKHGERMTLRLLAIQTEQLTLEALGMSEDHRDRFEQCINKPYGMILLTGPTGSGKTTTLYAAIRHLLKHKTLNVVTVEDPVEYEINGVAQVEVDSADKVSFARALRSIVRHDPDVVMIGEIRDFETADVAIKAALTGHLVFSTLHTNSATGAVTRLLDMGIPSYLVAATLRVAVAQRLVRKLCRSCCRPVTMTEQQALAIQQEHAVGKIVYEPQGCIYCANRGYVGRLGLFEMLPTDESWAAMISEGATENELFAKMRQCGLKRLVDDGAEKLLSGHTSYAEVMSAVTVW